MASLTRAQLTLNHLRKRVPMYRLSLLLVALLLFADREMTGAENLPFDIVLQKGRIVDGSGAPWYVADVGIRDGKIAKIGHIAAEEAATLIDASGLIVAPGFIDMMGQTATPMLDDPKTAINLLTQARNDGDTAFAPRITPQVLFLRGPCGPKCYVPVTPPGRVPQGANIAEQSCTE